jgi:hypothetical protein
MVIFLGGILFVHDNSPSRYWTSSLGNHVYPYGSKEAPIFSGLLEGTALNGLIIDVWFRKIFAKLVLDQHPAGGIAFDRWVEVDLYPYLPAFIGED